MSATVRALWSKRAHRGPMDALGQATFVAGRGIDGSVDRSTRRQVTLIEEERWREFMATLGADVDPGTRRANVMLRGIVLSHTRGRILRLGDTVRLQIGGETTPCERMEDALSGLQELMRTNWGGGAFAQVITGGTVRVGDAAQWERDDA